MESDALQHKLEAAKRHMIQVKKKKKQACSSVNTQDVKVPVHVNVSQAAPSDTVEECLAPKQEEHSPYKQEEDSMQKIESSQPVKEKIVTISDKWEKENVLSKEWSTLLESKMTLEHTVNELKSHVSFLQTAYTEMNEKLNIILSKIETDHSQTYEKKETLAIDQEKINQLETIVKDLADKVEKIGENTKQMEISPIIHRNPQVYEDLSFDDISLNTIHTSPITKKHSQSYETCKIDLRKTGGCVGCSGNTFEV